MPVRRVVAHPKVKADRDRFAIERGPLVYCAEGADNGGQGAGQSLCRERCVSRPQERPDLLGGSRDHKMTRRRRSAAHLHSLLCLVPPRRRTRCASGSLPSPRRNSPRIAGETDSVEACFDGNRAEELQRPPSPRFTWWDHRGHQEWVERSFRTARRPSSVGGCIWFDDTGSGSLPRAAQVLARCSTSTARNGNPSKAYSANGVHPRWNKNNVVKFKPVLDIAGSARRKCSSSLISREEFLSGRQTRTQDRFEARSPVYSSNGVRTRSEAGVLSSNSIEMRSSFCSLKLTGFG